MRVLQMETENFTVCGCVCDVSFVWPDAKCVNDILHIIYIYLLSISIHRIGFLGILDHHGCYQWTSTCRFSRLKKSRYE